MARKVVQEEYGYKNDLPSYLKPFLKIITHFHPGWRNSQLNELLYVPFIENGLLLDIGCGNGNAMERFQKKGWNVVGTDFDPKAVNEALNKGLNVHLGDLREISFPDNTYDVVFLSHVIEHVPDPIELLAECYRILKPNGLLIALTPNVNANSHARFKEHWRGLEIPRHLQIFTPTSLSHAAEQAGFENVSGQTCIQGIFYLRDASAEHVKTDSFELPAPKKLKRIRDQIYLFTSGIRFAIYPGKEETILLHCKK